MDLDSSPVVSPHRSPGHHDELSTESSTSINMDSINAHIAAIRMKMTQGLGGHASAQTSPSDHEPVVTDSALATLDHTTLTKLADARDQDIEESRRRKEDEEGRYEADFLDLDEDDFNEDEEDDILNYDSDKDDYDAEPQVARKGSKRSLTHATTKGSSKKAKTAVPRKPGRPKKKSRADADAPNEHTAKDLLTNNIFDDQARTSGLRAQPTLQSANNRRVLLQQLINSIPTEERAAAKDDYHRLDEAIRDIDGQRTIVAGESHADGWKLKGMKTPLKHYQVMALAFMRRRERAIDDAPSGILGDGMGLGKTVMVLANIVNGAYARQHYNALNRQEPGFTPKPRPTLIVVPSSLVMQWKAELKQHVHYNNGGSKASLSADQKYGLFNMLEFRDIARMSPDGQVKEMSKQDVVFTTYHAVRKSCPKMKPPASITTAKAKAAWYKDQFDKYAGPLHKVHWQRVVLDEAHYIKNHLSGTSLACRALEAHHYWAVSGTPVQNSLREFYPYLRFIRDRAVTTYRQFNTNFSGDPETEDGQMMIARLMALLGKYMIRRTHANTFMGAKLLDVPKAHKPTDLYLNFNATERRFYEIVKRKFIHRIEEMTKMDGSSKANYNHIYTLAMRLRQATGHVLLLHDIMVDIMDQADLEDLGREISQETENEDGMRAMLQMRYMLEQVGLTITTENNRQGHIEIHQGSEATTELLQMMPDAGDKLGGSHGTRGVHLAKYIADLTKGTEFETITSHTACADCNNQPVEPYITSCGHIYCEACLLSIKQRAVLIGQDMPKCTTCGDQFLDTTKCREGQESTAVDNGYDHIEAQPDNGTAGRTNPRDKPKRNQWLRKAGVMAPSTKTMMMKTQVLQWIEEDPDVKIIIFSQFLQLLDIIKMVCIGEKWIYRRYQGDMTLNARNTAISDFGNPGKKVRILLASLKCGGVGLNLTAASRVLIMDSWWNDSAEEQAFCRIFRHGQTKETKLTRLVIKDSVDEDMMRIKERKLLEIDPVLVDGKPLTKSELYGLFTSDNMENDQGPFVFAEDGDEVYEDDPQRYLDEDDGNAYRALENDP